MLEQANAYDKNGLMKREVDKALISLKEFRVKFPFTENPNSIEWLDLDSIFKPDSNETGEFARYLVYSLDPIGHLTIQSSNVYRNIRLQLGDFKNLLRVAVDKNKSLAQKVDAPWEKINGLGNDKELAKKIIFCFNYESAAIVPIFSTPHLRHFVNRIVDAPSSVTKFYSVGAEYSHYTAELLKAKNNLPITKSWETTYFARFLYQTYPSPDREPAAAKEGERKTGMVETNEQTELRGFVKLLGELQSKGKITGQQFREYRELWVKQQPNDRDVVVWQLKQLLKAETKPNPDAPKNQPPPKPHKL
jgi:hypothetical protein